MHFLPGEDDAFQFVYATRREKEEKEEKVF